MNDIICSKCGGKDFFMKSKVNSNQTGLYCKNCGRWIKWLSKDEVRVFEQQQNLRKHITKVNFLKCFACRYCTDEKNWYSLSFDRSIKICPNCGTLRLSDFALKNVEYKEGIE